MANLKVTMERDIAPVNGTPDPYQGMITLDDAIVAHFDDWPDDKNIGYEGTLSFRWTISRTSGVELIRISHECLKQYNPKGEQERPLLLELQKVGAAYGVINMGKNPSCLAWPEEGIERYSIEEFLNRELSPKPEDDYLGLVSLFGDIHIMNRKPEVTEITLNTSHNVSEWLTSLLIGSGKVESKYTSGLKETLYRLCSGHALPEKHEKYVV
ncbi:MAG: hypothetical protein WCV90_07290 [Candidatus Woesearchaeota archaeon]|jgi:hypothetical protein